MKRRHAGRMPPIIGAILSRAQDEELPIALPTPVNVVLAFWPKVVMAARQTTMMSASMTAYSTAVGPSSFFRKSTKRVAILANMADSLSVSVDVNVREVAPRKPRGFLDR